MPQRILLKLFCAKPSFHCVPRIISPLINRKMCVTDHSTPSCDKIKNTGSHNSAPPYDFLAFRFSAKILPLIYVLCYVVTCVHHTVVIVSCSQLLSVGLRILVIVTGHFICKSGKFGDNSSDF